MAIQSIDQADENLAMHDLPAEQNNAMLRAFLVASDHGVLLTDLDLNIIACNRRFGEIFGVLPSEALKMGMEKLRRRIYPMVRDADNWMASVNTLYQTPERIYEDTIELKKGRRLIIKRHSSPVRDSSGKIIGRVWTYRDDTTQHRLEEMHQILQQLSQTYDPSPDAVCRMVLEVVSKYYENTTAILSLRRGDFMDFRGVVGPKSAITRRTSNAFQDSYCQFAVSSERPVLIQNARKDKEYSHIPASRIGFTRYLGVPIYEEENNPIGTLCLLDGKSEDALDELDLHFMSLLAVRISGELARERHFAERLKEQEARFQRERAELASTNSVFEAMNAGFSLLANATDADTLLKEQTRLISGVLGYGGSAILIRRANETKFHGFASAIKTRRITAVTMEASEAPDPSTKGSIRMDSPNCPLATKLGAAHTACVLRTEEGVGDIVIVFGRDDAAPVDERHRIHLEAITDQVCLLLASHVLQNELVQANNELTQAHDQLLQKEKLSVVGTLAASTAHDIRNITASLAMLVAPGACPPEVALDAIREQLGRFNLLAHRLLSYAKPRMFAQEPVELGSVLEGVLSLTSAQVRVGNVNVVNKISQSLPSIVGDPHQLEHLFVNLILNGVQCMNATGGTLTVSAAVSGSQVKVKIVDSGPGISRDVQDRLFEPFASTKADGFGLGLYSCKRIVDAHGGTISAKRNPLRGSTFTVILPV